MRPKTALTLSPRFWWTLAIALLGLSSTLETTRAHSAELGAWKCVLQRAERGSAKWDSAPTAIAEREQSVSDAVRRVATIYDDQYGRGFGKGIETHLTRTVSYKPRQDQLPNSRTLAAYGVVSQLSRHSEGSSVIRVEQIKVGPSAFQLVPTAIDPATGTECYVFPLARALDFLIAHEVCHDVRNETDERACDAFAWNLLELTCDYPLR